MVRRFTHIHVPTGSDIRGRGSFLAFCDDGTVWFGKISGTDIQWTEAEPPLPGSVAHNARAVDPPATSE